MRSLSVHSATGENRRESTTGLEEGSKGNTSCLMLGMGPTRRQEILFQMALGSSSLTMSRYHAALFLKGLCDLLCRSWRFS